MKSKKILFDLRMCQPIQHIKFHGGGIYGYVVLQRLCKESPESVVVYWDKKRYIEPSIKEMIDDLNVESIDCNDVPLIDALSKFASVFYSPLYSKEYLAIPCSTFALFVTVHGLRKLEMNRDAYEIRYAANFRTKLKCIVKRTFLYKRLLKNYYNEYVDFFKRPDIDIITVSNHSKSSLELYYPFLKEEKIHVFYSPSTAKLPSREIKMDLPPKFYLIISADRWLKNSLRAIEALDRVFSSRPNMNAKVVVVGASPRMNMLKKIVHKDRFLVKDYVEKDELETLLKNAYLLIYPSLNEGFGYPPLEAMKYGTPVISSPFASISEICADAVVYANPYSVDEIAMRILYFENNCVYQEYQRRSVDRYALIEKKQDEDLNNMVRLLLGAL